MGEVIDGKQWQFNAEQIIGNGSFGVVFRATIVETGAVVAIKKVLQDKRFKNRELHIMKQLRSNPKALSAALVAGRRRDRREVRRRR